MQPVYGWVAKLAAEMLCDTRITFGCNRSCREWLVWRQVSWSSHGQHETSLLRRGVAQSLTPIGLISPQRYRETFVA